MIDKISQVTYEPNLAKALSDNTFGELDSNGRVVSILHPNVSRIKARKKRAILHLSDLHFGKDYAFARIGANPFDNKGRKTLSDCIEADLNRIGKQDQIAAILITGDFTTQGDWSDKAMKSMIEELTSLVERLGLTRHQLFIVPGNHDIVRYPSSTSVDFRDFAVANQTNYEHERNYRLFSEQLTGMKWSDPINRAVVVELESVDLQICLLNSCTIVATEWTEYGYVGPNGHDIIERLHEIVTTRPTVRALALHHHLLPVNRVDSLGKNGVSLTLDAVEVLDVASKHNVHIAFHGHQHVSRVTQYHGFPIVGESEKSEMVIISGGSSGVTQDRRPGSNRNTYSVVDFSESSFTIVTRELREDSVVGAQIYSQTLNIEPILPN